MKVRILLASALLTLAALPAAAQSVKLSFHGGKVDLSRRERHGAGHSHRVGARRRHAHRQRRAARRASGHRRIQGRLRAAGARGAAARRRRLHRRPAADGRRAERRRGSTASSSWPTSTAPRPAPVTPAVSRPPGPQPLRRLPAPIEDEPDDADDDRTRTVGRWSRQRPRPETPADLRRRLGQLLEAEPDDDDAEPDARADHAGQPLRRHHRRGAAGMITPVPAARPRAAAPVARAGTQP